MAKDQVRRCIATGGMGLLRARENIGRQPTPDPDSASTWPPIKGREEAILGCGGETISKSFPAALQRERCLMRH
jgi:hypothetical protein